MKECSKVYERIATGQLPSRLVYKNLEHGVMVLVDPMPAARGHLAVASLACAESVDDITSRVLHNKLSTAAQFAGKVLKVAYPKAPYIAELTASNQIAHPHIHRLPGDEQADWAKRFAHLENWPRLELDASDLDNIKDRLMDPLTVGDLWLECDDEIAALGAPDDSTIRALQELGLS